MRVEYGTINRRSVHFTTMILKGIKMTDKEVLEEILRVLRKAEKEFGVLNNLYMKEMVIETAKIGQQLLTSWEGEGK